MTTRLRVLATGPGLTADVVEALSRWADVDVESEMPQSALESAPSRYDGYLLGGDERLSGDVLRAGPLRLRHVAFVGTGAADFIDLDAARQVGVSVSTVPKAAGNAVAEHALALVLAAAHGIVESAQSMRAGEGTQQPPPKRELRGLTAAVVGLGDIGSRVAAMLRLGFDCEVSYVARSAKPDAEDALGLRRASVEEAFAQSDVVVLALPLSAETESLVYKELLEQSPGDALLVNVGSARLVDPGALLAGLDDQPQRVAAFDSYWMEPPPSPHDDPYGLVGHRRFILTPHVAAKTPQAWSRMVRAAAANLKEALKGEGVTGR